MSHYLFIGYEMVTVLVPFLLALALRARAQREEGNSLTVFRGMFLLLFGCYICGVFYFTGVSTIYDLFYYGLEIRGEQLNLIPFSHKVDVTDYLLNILLLMPLGFFLPVLWRCFRRFWRTLLAGFGFSLFIELSQLLNVRYTDVDDLIMNTLGAVLGYVCGIAFLQLIPVKKQAASGREAFFYIGVMFLGRFLLYNPMGLAKMLYGF